jgi:hypothetical protein
MILTSIIALMTGCSSTGSYTSGKQKDTTFYGDVTQKCIEYEGIERNPVIVVHGFLGSKLVNSITGENLWGDFRTWDFVSVSDEKIRGLAHPMGYKTSLKKLKNNIIPNELLETANVSCLGISVKVTAYKKLIDALVRVGYQTESRPLPKDKHFYNLFEFAYDWRRDLPETAKELDLFIKRKRKYLQQKYKELYGIENFDVKFNVIGHSMGGLLARYYLRYGIQDLPQDGSLPKLDWYGSKNIDILIAAGTPNGGYLDTFLEMLKGGYLQSFPPAVLGTFPTYYQMLPVPQTKSIVYSDTKEAVDVFDPEVWKKMKWGIVNPEEDETLKILLPNVKTKEERSKVAYDHLSNCLKRAKQFIEAMGIKASPPDDVLLFLVFGNGFKTSQRAFVNRNTGEVEEITYSSGDGKVLASSALWDERVIENWSFFLRSPIDWDYLLGLRAAHMGILEAPVFEDNILLLLSMIETQKQKETLDGITCSTDQPPKRLKSRKKH